VLHYVEWRVRVDLVVMTNRDARRIWFWRHSGLIFTVFICFLCGGIVSEFVQSMLPVRFYFTSLLFVIDV
jgi:hypothetical protein